MSQKKTKSKAKTKAGSASRKNSKKPIKNNRIVKKSGPSKTAAKTVKAAKPRVAVRNSPIHGRGVFAVNTIAKGARILEYTGERMSHAEADRRYGDLHDGSSHTMLFAATDKVDGRVFIDAIRPIQTGQELSYDYNLVLEERHTPKLKREHPCHCGVRKCRGTLLGSKR
jgi:SET domain-containing protein